MQTMSTHYFSERELGPKPRTENEVGANAWGGLVAFINTLIDNGYFGDKFPEMCPDNDGVVGTNKSTMSLAVLAEFPEIKFPLDASETPSTLTILDLLEFCHEHIAKPIQGSFHQYWGLHHLSFDVEAGKAEFRQRINRIFARNGIAFDLQDDGQITRLAPPVTSDYLNSAIFQTGDPYLDSMLETARNKYLDPSLQVRLEALEKLWDAWERIKTLEYPADKKKSVNMLLDKASNEPNMKERLDREAAELTEIGNKFMIRHTEAGKTPITSSAHVDYLFHRMFALIYLLLGNRIGKKLPEVTAKRENKGAKPVEEEMPF
jgi:hypothetical protein